MYGDGVCKWCGCGWCMDVGVGVDIYACYALSRIDATSLDLSVLTGWEAFEALEWGNILLHLGEEARAQLDPDEFATRKSWASSLQQLVRCRNGETECASEGG